MIWGMIHHKGGCPVVVCPSTVNKEEYVRILKKGFVPWINRYLHSEYVLMYDGASVHTSELATEFLQEKRIEYLDWPPSSPNLNPIENIWYLLKNELGKKESQKVQSRCWSV